MIINVILLNCRIGYITYMIKSYVKHWAVVEGLKCKIEKIWKVLKMCEGLRREMEVCRMLLPRVLSVLSTTSEVLPSLKFKRDWKILFKNRKHWLARVKKFRSYCFYKIIGHLKSFNLLSFDFYKMSNNELQRMHIILYHSSNFKKSRY